MGLDAWLDLPRDRQSAPAAREFVSATLVQWGGHELVEVAALLVTELVANAVVHAGTPVELRLSLDCGTLRVDVRDRTASVPRPVSAGTHAASGRGLRVVEALADDWGVVASGGGKVVWFELSSGGPGGTGRG